MNFCNNNKNVTINMRHQAGVGRVNKCIYKHCRSSINTEADRFNVATLLHYLLILSVE